MLNLIFVTLQVVEPIVMSKNEPDHDIKEATIMKQATLTQQRKRVCIAYRVSDMLVMSVRFSVV